MWVSIKILEEALDLSYNSARLEFNECRDILLTEGRTVRHKLLPKERFIEFYSSKYSLPNDVVTLAINNILEKGD